MKHPVQPLITDEYGTKRFKANAIVQYLLDNGGIDMNKLATLSFPQEDREQFAQLIGYSLDGYGNLDYVSDDTYDVTVSMDHRDRSETEARIEMLEGKLEVARRYATRLAETLFRIHPDDLKP